MSVEPTYLMVLGPMEPFGDNVKPNSRTLQLVTLLRSVCENIMSVRAGKVSPVIIEGPDERPANQIVQDILIKIERADLVVIDITGNSANVGYEIGIVHALGLPYILLTSDAMPMFYFRMTNCILGFDLADRHDIRRNGHPVLAERITEFLEIRNGTSSDRRWTNFTSSPPTDFFELPIIDISAASGIAAGYWRNSIRRFARSNGYFWKPRLLTWEGNVGAAAREEETVIGRFLAVKPPHDLLLAYDHDLRELEQTLQQLQYGLCRGIIRGLLDEPEDLRSFSATFLARLTTDGTLVPCRPLTVVEIPTTLYAFQDAPRIKRIKKEQGRTLEQLRLQRGRRLADMIVRFGSVLHMLISNENLDDATKFKLIGLNELPAWLRENAGPPAQSVPQ